ncbi:MAG: rod shape-determining protein MreC [Oscillospiraceae bacterium]|nr:rod shape-determining protein MreC [Oscillospiraceae bacterium]
MKEFFHSVRFKIIICIAALLLGLMTYVAVAAGTQTLPEQIINTVTYPFVTAANAISNGVNGFIDKLVNADTYKSQNDELRELVTQMYERTADYEELQKENEQLREMLNLSKKHEDFKFSEPCSIVARNANDIYGGFTINHGSTSGISLNDPIITSVGLIGRVTDIAPNYARVSTILSPQVNVGVYTQRTKTTGVLESNTATAEQGLCLMSNILKDADINPGDVIVTSGQSGLFPEGLIVGTVKEVYDDPNGLSKHALIEPAEDCFKITSVYAVVDFDGKGLSFDDIQE